MAATIDQIMTAFKERLATVDGVRAYDYAPDSPTPDKAAAFPLVPPVPSYREAMRRGLIVYSFRIALVTGAQLDRVGQQRLARYASATGPDSIRAALEDGTDTEGRSVKTLGGLVDDLVVDGFDPDGLQEVGLVGYYGGTFAVRVMASGE